MSGRLPALRPAEVIRVLERNGFRLLRSTKHRTYTDDATPPHLVTVPFILAISNQELCGPSSNKPAGPRKNFRNGRKFAAEPPDSKVIDSQFPRCDRILISAVAACGWERSIRVDLALCDTLLRLRS